MPSVLLAAAGTAGHILPAVAVASELEKLGYEPIFLGSSGIENSILPKQRSGKGYEMIKIPKLPVYRSLTGLAKNIALPFRLLKTVHSVKREILNRDIKAVIVFGGYISAPAIFAAHSLKIPLLVHEQNVQMGLANRLGARFADFLGYSFPSMRVPSSAKRARFTGLPLRSEIVKLATAATNSAIYPASDATLANSAKPAKPATLTNLAKPANSPNPAKLHLLVFGGSLGAMTLNNAVRELLESKPEILKQWQITHVSGKGKFSQLEPLQAKFADGYHLLEYADNLPELLSQADLVLCRSGASTVHELAALSKPSILVPLPIGNGEQAFNAKLLGEGAVVVPDSQLNGTSLSGLLADFTGYEGKAKLSVMAKAAYGVRNLDAAPIIAKELDQILAKKTCKSFSNTHFMAISGAGIAPIASCFEQFSNVTGCDTVAHSPSAKHLSGHSPEHLVGKQAVVYSSAIKPHNLERIKAEELARLGKLTLMHRSDALDLLLRLHDNIITVAGSHGKTTITAMLANVLDKLQPTTSSYVIGALADINGLATNGGKLAESIRISSTNFKKSGKKQSFVSSPQMPTTQAANSTDEHSFVTIVAEADESDGSFQKYHPSIAIISNIEADHLDYYGDYEGVRRAFLNYAKHAKYVVTTSEVASELGLENYYAPDNSLSFNLSVPGDYNQQNARLATKALELLGIDARSSVEALSGFKGAARRFEEHRLFGANGNEYLVIDDYAHHPTEIEKLIEGAVAKFGSNEFVLLFQGHLYSRTRDLASEFAAAISKASYPIVTKIYPAREVQSDFPDITPQTIAKHNPKIAVAVRETLLGQKVDGVSSSLDDALYGNNTVGVQMAIEYADLIRHKTSKTPVILSVGAGPSLIEEFKKVLRVIS